MTLIDWSILALLDAFLIAELLFPGLRHDDRWRRARGPLLLLFNVWSAWVVGLGWQRWAGEWQVLDAAALGPVAGAAIGALACLPGFVAADLRRWRRGRRRAAADVHPVEAAFAVALATVVLYPLLGLEPLSGALAIAAVGLRPAAGPIDIAAQRLSRYAGGRVIPGSSRRCPPGPKSNSVCTPTRTCGSTAASSR